MIIDGFVMATVSLVGFYLIYVKLPYRVKKWMERHSLLTDFCACVLTYMLFGGTLVALFASAWMGIMVSIMLAIVNHPGGRRALHRLGERLDELKIKFSNMLDEHFPPEPLDPKPTEYETAHASSR